MDPQAYYYQYPMMKEFDAVVQSCQKVTKGYVLTLDHTAFYPEGGGQPCDVGRIDTASVFDVQEKNHVVYHYVDRAFSVGQNVHGRIDWNRRFLMMQSHSGEHIVSGLVHAQFGYDNVGFHLDTHGLMTIDFNGVLRPADIDAIEMLANDVVSQDIPLTIAWPTKEQRKHMSYRSKKALDGHVRIVTIGPYDTCACCGTHVERTGQIGSIKILSLEKHRQGVRLQLICGRKAIMDHQQKHKICAQLSPLFSVPVEGIVTAVKKAQADRNEKSRTIRQWQDKYIVLKTAMLPSSKIQLIEEDVDRLTMRDFCNYILEHTDCVVAMVVAKNQGAYQYVMASQKIDLKIKVNELNDLLAGRGGGQKEMVQGTFRADIETIKKVIQQWNDSL